MRTIKVAILNTESVKESEQMMAFAARLTQCGHVLKSMDDVLQLYNREYSADFLSNLSNLPHPTLQKFSVINVVVYGVSRRFLQQITRHQNEVKFMSTSLQYSDYTNNQDMVVPYELLDTDWEEIYRMHAKHANNAYAKLAKYVGNDAAGYISPLGFRTCMIISATPYQWTHMIAQRCCRRNTSETRYVMLRIWEELRKLDGLSASFCKDLVPCQVTACPERAMSCGKKIPPHATPENIIAADFPKLMKEVQENEN